MVAFFEIDNLDMKNERKEIDLNIFSLRFKRMAFRQDDQNALRV